MRHCIAFTLLLATSYASEDDETPITTDQSCPGTALNLTSYAIWSEVDSSVPARTERHFPPNLVLYQGVQQSIVTTNLEWPVDVNNPSIPAVHIRLIRTGEGGSGATAGTCCYGATTAGTNAGGRFTPQIDSNNNISTRPSFSCILSTTPNSHFILSCCLHARSRPRFHDVWWAAINRRQRHIRPARRIL